MIRNGREYPDGFVHFCAQCRRFWTHDKCDGIGSPSAVGKDICEPCRGVLYHTTKYYTGQPLGTSNKVDGWW